MQTQVNDQLMNSMIGRSPARRRADAEPGERRLADRRVDDALRAELVEHPLGHLVGAVVLGDFLAHEEDVLVALHLLGHGGAEGFAELHLRASVVGGSSQWPVASRSRQSCSYWLLATGDSATLLHF